MSIIIERYEEFTARIANDTIGHFYSEQITDVDIRGLGEGVGLMSSIARGHLTLESGREETVIVKCIARTENSTLSNLFVPAENPDKNLLLLLSLPLPLE